MTSPTTTVDLYADDALADPYPIYEELRSLGSAVWMEPHQAFVLTRFAACRDALRNWRTFSSARGEMMNDPVNGALGGQVMLCTDGERHSKLRAVVGAPLALKALADVRPLIESEATALVDRLVQQGTFDAVAELAHHLPVTIVSELVGIPESGRERMVPWASAVFNSRVTRKMACRTSHRASFSFANSANDVLPSNCFVRKSRSGVTVSGTGTPALSYAARTSAAAATTAGAISGLFTVSA